MDDLKLFRSEGWYVVEIPSLHVVTRARTIPALKKNLKEAIEVAVEGLLILKSGRAKLPKVALVRAT